MRIDASSLGEGEARLHTKADGRRYWLYERDPDL